MEPIVLPSRAATSLALVIHELLQNALEHAFVGRASGLVTIRLGRGPQEYVVEVSYDGVGLPAPRAANLGLDIVETLVRDDLRGKLELTSNQHGTQAVVRMPKSSEPSSANTSPTVD